MSYRSLDSRMPDNLLTLGTDPSAQSLIADAKPAPPAWTLFLDGGTTGTVTTTTAPVAHGVAAAASTASPVTPAWTLFLDGGTTGTVTTTTAPVVRGVTAAANTASPAIGAVITTGNKAVTLSSLFHLPTGSGAPNTLILNVLDRIEYTKGFNSSALGTVGGSLGSVHFTSNGGDAMTIGLAFTYQATTGRYFNASVGYLDQVQYNTSANQNDQVSVSLYACSSASTAQAYAAASYTLMDNPAVFSYGGSVTVVVEASPPLVPLQATPGSEIAAALGMVGQAWNNEGCWLLASTIAAKAGASLPVTSTLVGGAAQANGEWIVAYNGAVSANSNWEASLRAGEVVSFMTTSGGGHITTVVGGSGATATLVDNITYVNGKGQFINSANDGQASDVIIATAHAAMQEFSGVNAQYVTVYELDTPIVTAVASLAATTGTTVSLAGDFTAINPLASQSITTWQIYESTAADGLSSGGSTTTMAISAASALSVTSLSGLSLVASTVGIDTLTVRAFNGSYWGDWTSLAVTIAAPKPLTVAQAIASGTGGGAQLISDSAANVAGNIVALERLAGAGVIKSITLTDKTTPTISLAGTQVAASLPVLGTITGAYTLAVAGTSGADTVNLAGVKAPVTVSLGTDTASATGGLAVARLLLAGTPDALVLGTATETVNFALQSASGIETVANFQYGLDTLAIQMMGASSGAIRAVGTTLGGSAAISIYNTADPTHGLVLTGVSTSMTAANLLAGHTSFSAGVMYVH